MEAADYFEWSTLSGLYLRNRSCSDRYLTYRTVLSTAGLTTVVVSEFLKDTATQWSVEYWRTNAVYENSDERLELTAVALDAIGAAKLAVAVRLTKIGSPLSRFPTTSSADNTIEAGLGQAERSRFEKSTAGPGAPSHHETREEVTALLKKYVDVHQSQLQSDLDQHGDPRTKPGYTRKGRLSELEAMRMRYHAVINQRSLAQKLDTLTVTLQELAAPPGGWTKKHERRFQNQRNAFRDQMKQARAYTAEDPIPELIAALANAEAFISAHADLFKLPTIGDEQTMSRLAALGEYELRTQMGKEWFEWDTPSGFSCDWTEFTLHFSIPQERWSLLPEVLDAVDQLKGSFVSRVAGWRRDLLSNFRDLYPDQLRDWELEEYELDEHGQPTEASILSHVDAGVISLDFSSEGFEAGVVHFAIDWDQEHGFECFWHMRRAWPG